MDRKGKKIPGSPTGQLVSGTPTVKTANVSGADNGVAQSATRQESNRAESVESRFDTGQADKEGQGGLKNIGAESHAAAAIRSSSNAQSVSEGNRSHIVKPQAGRTINIATLNEAELLDMIQQYVTSMNKFVSATRNVHKELKENLPKTHMLLTRYRKLKEQGRGDTGLIICKPAEKGAGNSVATQTPTPTNIEEPVGPLMSMLEKIREQLATQQGSTDQEAAERNHRLKRQENKQQKRNQQQQEQRQKQSPSATTNQRNDRTKRVRPEPLKEDENRLRVPELLVSHARTNQVNEVNAAKLSETYDANAEIESIGYDNGFKLVTKKKRVKNRIKSGPDTIVVKVDANKTYANTLREVRHGLGNAGLTDGVTQARKTMNGNLLLKLKGNALTDQIRSVASTCSGTEAFSLLNKVAVEFRGLDGDITKDELADHLKTAHPGLCTDDVKALKTGQDGSITGVVLLPTKVANKLATGPKIKIGWSLCRVHVRIPMVRCSRCLEFGHRKHGCKGPDRTNTCKRCWGLGHSSKDCEAAPKCGLCNNDISDESGNHYSGSSRCLAFKRFLSNNKHHDKISAN